jgi:hypothetical protein
MIVRLLAALTLLVAGPVLGGAAAGARETQASGPPNVEVLDAGSEPGEVLRLAPAVGASEASTMTMRVDLEQSGVSDLNVKAPPIRAQIAAALQDLTPEGDLHASFSYPSFEVLRRKGTSSQQRTRLVSALDQIEGLSGDLTLTARGVLRDSNLDIPDDADPSITQFVEQLRDQLRNITIPLPEEAVGVGARWRATTPLTLNGIRVRNVFEYRLKSRTGTTLELDVRGTQTARRQTVESDGATVRVKSFKTTFRGATTMDLTRLLPVASRVRGTGDQKFDVKEGDDSGELRQHVEVEATLEPD